jgi:hypothetical protein
MSGQKTIKSGVTMNERGVQRQPLAYAAEPIDEVVRALETQIASRAEFPEDPTSVVFTWVWSRLTSALDRARRLEKEIGTHEAATMLDTTPRSVRRWVKNGLLDGRLVGGEYRVQLKSVLTHRGERQRRAA